MTVPIPQYGRSMPLTHQRAPASQATSGRPCRSRPDKGPGRAKKNGCGGKYTWVGRKALLDEANDQGSRELDAEDPNYDSDEQDLLLPRGHAEELQAYKQAVRPGGIRMQGFGTELTWWQLKKAPAGPAMRWGAVELQPCEDGLPAGAHPLWQHCRQALRCAVPAQVAGP